MKSLGESHYDRDQERFGLHGLGYIFSFLPFLFLSICPQSSMTLKSSFCPDFP